MNQGTRLENIYDGIRDFIKRYGDHRIAVRLQYLMTKGCWNSWSELLKAVDEAFAELSVAQDQTDSSDIVHEAQSIRKAIAEFRSRCE